MRTTGATDLGANSVWVREGSRGHCLNSVGRNRRCWDSVKYNGTSHSLFTWELALAIYCFTTFMWSRAQHSLVMFIPFRYQYT